MVSGCRHRATGAIPALARLPGHLATTADEGAAYVTREGIRVVLYFTLGNCPCEVLADHSDHKGLTADLADLDMGEC